MRLTITVDDDDIQERLILAQRDLAARDYNANRAADVAGSYPSVVAEFKDGPAVAKMAMNSTYGKFAKRRKRKLSKNPSAVRARKARAAKVRK